MKDSACARSRRLHAAYAFPAAVTLQDGGTLGLNLYEQVAGARRVLVFDAIDFNLAPGTLRVLRDAEVPRGAHQLSPHQVGFNDILGLAQLNGRAPDSIVAIGVQPVVGYYRGVWAAVTNAIARFEPVSLICNTGDAVRPEPWSIRRSRSTRRRSTSAGSATAARRS